MLLSLMFVNSFFKGKSSYAKTFGALCLSLQIYLLGYLLEINTDTLKQMLFWNQIQYFGIPFFPTLWLLVSMQYTGRGKKYRKLKGILLFIIPCMTFLVRLTNNWHHLYYKRIELQQIKDLELMFLTKGPWYFIQMGYVLITLVICTWFYFQRYSKSIGDEKIQFKILLTASTLPYISLILVSTNLGGIGIDYTAIILPPCVLMIHLAMSRYNFLEIKLLGRERVFENSLAGLILLNRFYRVVDYNNASVHFAGWFSITIKEEQMEILLKDQEELLKNIKNLEEKIFHLLVEDEDHYVYMGVREIKNKQEIVGYLVTLEDVTERELLRKRLIEMASIDELSGLNNRRRFRESAEEILQRARRYQENVSVLMMDIDYFKKVNDSYGHQVGDAVIKEFAKMLSTVFRGTDIIGRMGGEEFAVIMLHIEMDNAYQKAEIFRESIEHKTMVFGQHQVKITVSIGISVFGEKAQNLDTLINLADNALYEAKRQGRNRTIISESP